MFSTSNVLHSSIFVAILFCSLFTRNPLLVHSQTAIAATTKGICFQHRSYMLDGCALPPWTCTKILTTRLVCTQVTYSTWVSGSSIFRLFLPNTRYVCFERSAPGFLITFGPAVFRFASACIGGCRYLIHRGPTKRRILFQKAL